MKDLAAPVGRKLRIRLIAVSSDAGDAPAQVPLVVAERLFAHAPIVHIDVKSHDRHYAIIATHAQAQRSGSRPARPRVRREPVDAGAANAGPDLVHAALS